MKIAVVDYGDNLKILEALFKDRVLLRGHWLESIQLKPIVVYDTEAQRKEAVENLRDVYSNVDELVVTYEEGLERLKALADDVSVLVISETLGREGAGLDLVGDVRKGNLGERLEKMPIAVIACGDPLSPHIKSMRYKVELCIDYVANVKYQDALLELIAKVK